LNNFYVIDLVRIDLLVVYRMRLLGLNWEGSKEWFLYG
jgi:hypothetical protein